MDTLRYRASRAYNNPASGENETVFGWGVGLATVIPMLGGATPPLFFGPETYEH